MESTCPPDPGVEAEVEGGSPRPDPEEAEVASDPELEELLDISLNEFGKHLPGVSGSGATQTSAKGDRSPSPRASPVAGVEEFEEIFSEEFAAQAEAQLDEAMHMLAAENPELWKELETLAQSVGQPGGEEAVQEGSEDGASSLDAKLEETIKQLRQSTEQIESGGGGAGGLSDLLGGLDLNAEGGEDSLVQVMEGVMSTLLSKDVLYPSLSELCSQYPEWLDRHKQELSSEDYTRYSRQLEVMRAICGEFEHSSEAGEKQAKFETILQLMQQLQQYGQPPDELAGQTANLPTQLQSAQNCPVM